MKTLIEADSQRIARPADDCVHMRMQLMIEALVAAMEQAGSADPLEVAFALEAVEVTQFGQTGRMRANDHQFQQSLVVGRMQQAGSDAVPFDVEGSGYGFEVIRSLAPEQAELPHSCTMERPPRAS